MTLGTGDQGMLMNNSGMAQVRSYFRGCGDGCIASGSKVLRFADVCLSDQQHHIVPLVMELSFGASQLLGPL